jgi:VWFA-related protein
MSIKRYCVVAAVSFGVWIVPARSALAQQKAAPSDSPGKIQLDVAVTTTKGQPAGELSEKDFTVLDNKSPSPIASFTPVEGKNGQVEVVIVIDSVNTPFTYLGYQRDQIAKYLRSNGGALPYPTTFAVLTDTSFQMYEGASKDGNALADKLEHADIGLREINRSQGFWGAADRMTLSLNALRSLTVVEEKKPGRKLVLWVSPGWPLLSGPEVELDGNEADEVYHNAISFSRELRKADITLYSVNSWGVTESVGREFYYQSFLKGLKGPADAEWGNLSLQVLAAQSGGLVLSSNDAVTMIKQCVADADQYYRIVLDPAPDGKPNEFHQIEVKVAQNGLVARTRTAYYGRP